MVAQRRADQRALGDIAARRRERVELGLGDHRGRGGGEAQIVREIDERRGHPPGIVPRPEGGDDGAGQFEFAEGRAPQMGDRGEAAAEIVEANGGPEPDEVLQALQPDASHTVEQHVLGRLEGESARAQPEALQHRGDARRKAAVAKLRERDV